MNIMLIVTKKKYFNYVKYFSLVSNNEILEIMNLKIKNYLQNNSLSNTDLFLENCNHYYYDLFYLDFLSKFFFKKSFVRYKLNLIIALHEADYKNFDFMINNTNIFKIFLDLFKFTLVFFTSLIWLIYKFFKIKIKIK